MTVQPARVDAEPHVCKPGAILYYCPTSGRTESDCHGGFDTCCDRPDLHQLACGHCGGTGCDPEDPGDYDQAVHQHTPGTRGPCPECIQKGLPPRLDIAPISLRKADVDLATAERSRDGWRRDYAELAEAYKTVYADRAAERELSTDLRNRLKATSDACSNATTLLYRIGELHTTELSNEFGATECRTCRDPWPCDTANLLAALEPPKETP